MRGKTIGHRSYAGCQNVDGSRPSPNTPANCSALPYAYARSRTRASTPTWLPSGAILATHVEAPRLSELGVKHVNDLSEADGSDSGARLRQPAPAGDCHSTRVAT